MPNLDESESVEQIKGYNLKEDYLSSDKELDKTSSEEERAKNIKDVLFSDSEDKKMFD